MMSVTKLTKTLFKTILYAIMNSITTNFTLHNLSVMLFLSFSAVLDAQCQV